MVQLKETITLGGQDGAFSTSCLSKDPAWPGGTKEMLRAQNDQAGNLTLTSHHRPKKKKGKTIYCLEDGMGDYLHDLGIEKDSQRPQALTIRES